MSKRIIYSEFTTPESVCVVEILKEKYSWEPIFFHGNKYSNSICKEKFHSAQCVDYEMMRKGIFDYGELKTLEPIDGDIIAKLSKFELNYLNWLEDSTGWEFSFSQRRRYYYDVLNYWNTVIKELKPDIFITYNWPHLATDYALYLLCKYVYDIPVLFLDVVPRNNSLDFNIGISLEELSVPFVDYYKSEKSKNISSEVYQYLGKMRSEQPKRPWYIDRYFDVHLIKQKKEVLLKRLRMIVSTLIGRSLKPSNSAFKKNRFPIGDRRSQMTILDYFIFREKLKFRNKKIQKYYNSLCVCPDERDQFVLFAAPYQPEAFSNLITGVYEDVFLILDCLLRALPNDWIIYYKEHPTIFNEYDKGAISRNEEFYNRLSSYSRVKCISVNHSTFELLDNSKCVVTTGGTIGWEAVVRSKPAIVFGSMWYVECNSVFHISKLSELIEAINKIENGFIPDEDDVNRYAEAIYTKSIKNFPVPYYFKDTLDYSKDIKDQMIKAADSFYDAYKEFYESKK